MAESSWRPSELCRDNRPIDVATALVGDYGVVNVILGLINNQLTLGARPEILIVRLGASEFDTVAGHLVRNPTTAGHSAQYVLYGTPVELVDELHHLEVVRDS